MTTATITLIGGPTALIELNGFRLLTDPTFDGPGEYVLPHVTLKKTGNPALTPDQIGPIDAVLLSHDQHSDNLDNSGRAFLQNAKRVLTTKAAAKHLGEGASIINISSVVTSLTPANFAVYAGTKGAVDAITGVLARELGPKKIRVNALNPGFVETEGTHSAGLAGSDFERGAVAQTPLGRAGQPRDIASAAVFLASEDSAWLTGERIVVSGGLR